MYKIGLVFVVLKSKCVESILVCYLFIGILEAQVFMFRSFTIIRKINLCISLDFSFLIILKIIFPPLQRYQPLAVVSPLEDRTWIVPNMTDTEKLSPTSFALSQKPEVKLSAMP